MFWYTNVVCGEVIFAIAPINNDVCILTVLQCELNLWIELTVIALFGLDGFNEDDQSATFIQSDDDDESVSTDGKLHIINC